MCKIQNFDSTIDLQNFNSTIDLRVQIARFLFFNSHVFARHLHIVWSWKWFAVKVSCIHSFRDWYIHRRWYLADAQRRAEEKVRQMEALKFQEETVEHSSRNQITI